MSYPSEQTESLGALVQRLLDEHREFSSQGHSLNEKINELETFDQLLEIFTPLKEALSDHMLVEETEIFPEVSSRGLFNERVSEIMQQHLDITAALDKMKFAIRAKNLNEVRAGFDELSSLMNLHFPAEEQEVFPLVA